MNDHRPAPLDRLTDDVVDWANQIAPDRRPKDTVVKLVSETSELLDAVLNKDPAAVREELGDLTILLVDLARMYNVNLVHAAEDKMEVNRERKWEVRDGVMRRIR